MLQMMEEKINVISMYLGSKPMGFNISSIQSN
jgi:hypothetical protein